MNLQWPITKILEINNQNQNNNPKNKKEYFSEIEPPIIKKVKKTNFDVCTNKISKNINTLISICNSNNNNLYFKNQNISIDFKSFLIKLLKDLAKLMEKPYNHDVLINNLFSIFSVYNLSELTINTIMMNILQLLLYNNNFISFEHRLNIINNFQNTDLNNINIVNDNQYKFNNLLSDLFIQAKIAYKCNSIENMTGIYNQLLTLQNINLNQLDQIKKIIKMYINLAGEDIYILNKIMMDIYTIYEKVDCVINDFSLLQIKKQLEYNIFIIKSLKSGLLLMYYNIYPDVKKFNLLFPDIKDQTNYLINVLKLFHKEKFEQGFRVLNNYSLESSDYKLIFNFAICYEFGFGTKVDNGFAVNRYSFIFDLGTKVDNDFESEILYRLGKNYFLLNNIENAIKYYEKSAQLGHNHSIHDLANYYYSNDKTESIKLWNINKNKCFTPSINILALYLFCDNFDLDNKKNALQLWRESFKYGDKDSILGVILAYNYQYGLQINSNKIINLLTMASIENNDNASFLLGDMYFYGINGLVDKEKAFYYWGLSAKNDHVQSIIKIANCYLYGDGVNRNVKKAVYLFKMLANKGNYVAMNTLAMLYFEGLGVVKDISKAISIWKFLAHKQFKDALYIFGLCYYNGIGVDIDVQKSFMLLNDFINI